MRWMDSNAVVGVAVKLDPGVVIEPEVDDSWLYESWTGGSMRWMDGSNGHRVGVAVLDPGVVVEPEVGNVVAVLGGELGHLLGLDRGRVRVLAVVRVGGGEVKPRLDALPPALVNKLADEVAMPHGGWMDE